MRHITFSPDGTKYDTYAVALLVPDFREREIRSYYVDRHLSGSEDELVAFDLYKNPIKKKTPMKEMKEYLGVTLLPTLRELEVEYIVVCDADYFKALTKSRPAEANLGYVMASEGEFKDDSKQEHSLEGFKVVYVPNFNAVFRHEQLTLDKIEQGFTALKRHAQGDYETPGSNIIHSSEYPTTPEEIKIWLDKLIKMDCPLTSDIEALSLKHYSAGIGTITFCWDQHNGIAFGVDLMEGDDGMPVPRPKKDSRRIREMLQLFFRLRAIKNLKTIWHNISYDAYVLIYQLYMKDLLDQKGMLTGLEVMLADGAWEDTKLITYLATNSCSGNNLGLKDQSQEFAGNYSVEEIKDITKIPFKRLIKYNLVDGLCTWFTYYKHWNTMNADNQRDIYEGLFKASTVDIIQMQLTGMPIDMDETVRLNAELIEFQDNAAALIMSNPLVDDYLYHKRLEFIVKENQRLKTKIRTMDEAKKKVDFNLNSPDDLKGLLYGEAFMALPVLDYTDTKEPATGGDTLKKLINHTDRDDVIEFLKALMDYKDVNKLITSFLPAMLNAQKGPDGWHYLFGNFNLGGTVTGRLSSSGPNLQNLPAQGYWAKKVKECFKAPPGWLFVGLDFASLEDRISALQTRDPEKLKVYLDGYDGHCLRAYAYFGELMPDIDPNSVDSINSIAKKYKSLRQDGKTPTFALTYAGTAYAIMDQCGWAKEKAQMVEQRFKKLYHTSIEYVADKIQQASKDGYVTVAFGLRVRTPILKKTILKTRSTPKEAEAEARTAGNALGQSYCLLNSRASNEFMGKVRKSEHRLLIRPSAHIHDAQYFMIPENLAIIMYMNEHLVKAVEWQDDPNIYHPKVKLGGELSIFTPSWAWEMELPNGVTEEEFHELAQKHVEEVEEKMAA